MINRVPYYMPQRNNVVGMWSLEERDNAIRRSSLNYIHLDNIYGNVLRKPGAVRSATNFNSRDDYLTTMDEPIGFDFTNDLTVSFRLNIREMPASSTNGFFISGKLSSVEEILTNCSWALFATIRVEDSVLVIAFLCIDDTGVMHYEDWYLNIKEIPEWDEDVGLGMWYHYVFTLWNVYGEIVAPLLFKDKIGLWFQNQVNFPSAPFNIKVNTYPIKVGFLPYTGSVGFDCSLDELIIWDKSLMILSGIPEEILEDIFKVFDLIYKPMQCRAYII